MSPDDFEVSPLKSSASALESQMEFIVSTDRN